LREAETVLAIRKIESDAKVKEMEEARRYAFEKLRIEESLQKGSVDLRANTARDELAIEQENVNHELGLASVSGGDLHAITKAYLLARKKLLEVSEEEEERAEDEKYAKQIKEAQAAGVSTVQIEAEIEKAKAAIRSKNKADYEKEADRINAVVKGFEDAATKVAAAAAKRAAAIDKEANAYHRMAGAVQESTAALVAAARERLKEANAAYQASLFRTQAGDFASGGSIGIIDYRGMAAQAWAEKQSAEAMLRAAMASGGGSGGGGANVKVNIYNSAGDLVGVSVPRARSTPSGSEIDVMVAQAIINGGYTARAIDDRVNGGVGA